MNSKLTDIKYKKGDKIKLTDEYLNKINYDKRMEEINNSNESEEGKVEALELLEEIRVGIVLDYIKKNSVLDIDPEEYNLLFNILKEQFDKAGVEYTKESLEEQTISHLANEVIYDTFAKENNIEVKESEITKMIEIANDFLPDFKSFSDLEKRAFVVENLRKSKVQKVFREFFDIDFSCKENKPN